MSTVAAEPAVGPEFFHPNMPLEQLRPSPLNPRKHFDAAHLEELAQSFAGVGIIEPLVARPVGDHYEIVCGDRRSRAARIAALTTVPVIVKRLTDAQALEVMVIENNQREDVNALEEGDGFRRLLDAGYDLDKLAERLGRSKKYIYDRIKLLDLTPTAKDLLLAGRLTAGHAILLARLKDEDQARALDPTEGGAFKPDYGAVEEEELGDQPLSSVFAKDAEDVYVDKKPASVRELNHWISRHVRFDVKHAAAAAPLDYGAVGERVDAAESTPGRGKKVIAITFINYHIPPEAQGEDRTYGPSSFKLADGKPHYDYNSAKSAVAPVCEHSVLGVVAVGDKYGQAFDVCIARDKCQVHWKKEIAERTKNQKLRESGQGAKAAKNEAKQQESWEAEYKREQEERRRQANAWDAVRGLAIERLAAALKKVAAGRLAADAWDVACVDLFLDAADKKLLERLIGKITPANLALAIVLRNAFVAAAREHAGFVDVAKSYGVDLSDLTAQYNQLLAGAAVQTSAPKSGAKAKGKKKR